MTVEVVNEPLTYTQEAPHSYFRDQLHASGEARGRLERHAQETRVNQGTASTMAIPQWLVESTAVTPRASRVLAALVQHLPLPRGVKSINVPRIVTGSAVQPVQDGEPSPDVDITDAGITSNVVTLTGQVDVAQQLLDQSPNAGAHIDYVIFRDLTSAYDAQLEYQMLFGSGTGQNLLGIANQVASSHQIAYTSGSPTVTGIFGPLGQAMAKIGNDRGAPPQLWLLRTNRWAWLATSDAATGSGTGALLMSDYGESGQGLIGVRARLDDAIPNNLGTATNQDMVFCVRPDDIILFEAPLRTLVTPEPLSGTLQARFQLMGQAAMTNLYPSAHATVGGTGMSAPAGY